MSTTTPTADHSHLFTSESVSEGHPDKLADRISDRILDAFLERDPHSRVACETMLADQCVIVAGEFKTRRFDDFHAVRDSVEALVRQVLRDTGYRSAETGIDPDACEIQIRFNGQSREISQGVDRSDGILGAGDQGLMFGYACDETPELMPAPIVYAHRLVRRQAEARKSGLLPWLGPDAKSQVTFRYIQGRPVQVEAVVLSTQHDAGIKPEALRAEVRRHIIDPVIPEGLRSQSFRTLINPTGSFVTGGPKGDAGLTGRKIIVDTYGGAAPHGGGAFSGKIRPRWTARPHTWPASWPSRSWRGAGHGAPGSVGVRHRHGGAGQFHGRHLRHRDRARRRHRLPAPPGIRPAAAGDH
jgi:S-adenosylmethionine synthetase